jgi:predicted RNase H-like HicB family nuclease
VTETNRYPARVFWSDEDDGYIAVAPDLPGCSAFGATQGEALGELQNAITAWIGAQQAAGNPVPTPSNPASETEYSGKVLVRMPRELHAALANRAKTQDVSLNQYVVYLLGVQHTRHVSRDFIASGTMTSLGKVITQGAALRWRINTALTSFGESEGYGFGIKSFGVQGGMMSPAGMIWLRKIS